MGRNRQFLPYMPKEKKTKISKTKKQASKPSGSEITYPEEKMDESLEEELTRYEGTNFTSLIAQIQSEYDIALNYTKPKIEEWALRLKLYNNQKRDKEAVGDPLMFTAHQTVLASLYSDRLTTEFGAREEGDEETAENLNSLAAFDEDNMEKDMIDYAWDWDASFFGRGLILFNQWELKTNTPIPENIDPMTWIRDPRAKSVNGDRMGRGAMRFGGREISLTKNEMKRAKIYFNLDDLVDSSDPNSLFERNAELRSEAQGLGSPTQRKALVGENKDYRLVEWFTIWNGNKLIVTLSGKRTKIHRLTIIDEETWPILDRCIYPMSHDWDSVSIPDLTEDKQRARSVMQNLGIQVAKANLHQVYLFNTTKIKNKADLNFEMNKFVGVDGPVNDAMAPLNTNGIKSDVQWILDVLDTAAQRATATPEIQQGVQSEDKRTLGEINLVASKVDTRYSLSAKVFGWSEKRFWKQWYRLYKKHFADGIAEKVIRISGSLGPQWRTFSRDNIVMSEDPDVTISSKILADEQRLQKLQMFRGFVKDTIAIVGPDKANVRFMLKHLGKLSGLSKDEIDRVLPPTYDELEAEDENNELNAGKMVEVEPTDDDMIHMEMHNKAKDGAQKYAHMNAHKRNMLLKKERPELFPQPTVSPQTDIAGAMDKFSGIGGKIPQPANMNS